MKTFVFTFGGCHPLFQHMYTKITAKDYFEARKKLCEIVGNKWAFQYTLEQWLEWENSENAKYFPKETYISFEEIKAKIKETC